jgi:small subunit ribosomal protein S7
MPRKGPAEKRRIIADPVYESPLVTQLVNKVLLDGKRSTAQRIVYGALEGTRAKTDADPVTTLRRAVDNVKPTLEVRSRRVGGATYPLRYGRDVPPPWRFAGSSPTPGSVASAR